MVASWYCFHFDLEDAIDNLRQSICSYNNRNGIINSDSSGYHETGTVFWASIVADLIENLPQETTFAEATVAVLDFVAKNSNLLQQYYSFDIIGSRQARLNWIEPDLQKLPREKSAQAL